MTARPIRFAVPGTIPAYQVKLTATEARALIEDIQVELEALDTVDHEALEGLIDSAVWTDDGDGRQWSFNPALSDALDWYCSSCREDVGWAKKSWLDREGIEVTITVICGHCGSDHVYDATGERTDS